MPKYKIHWDYGYGVHEETIEADTLEDAEEEAYQNWREGAESQADYGAEEVEGE